jgi:hypothetical protein
MFKKLLIIGIAFGAVVVLSLGAIGFAYAQTANPTDGTPVPQWGGRGGMMNGDWTGRGGMMGGNRGTRGGMMGWQDGSYGPMHEYMISALAEGLDMTSEELQARIDQGETPYQVAQSAGLSDEQITTLFDEAHDKALQAAVDAGALTQEQADWMESHHEQMWQNGTTPGAGGCMGGGRGRCNGQTQP